MRLLTFAICVLTLTSCATAIRLTPTEECALQDMKLAGISMSEGTGTAVTMGNATAYGNSGYSASANYSATTVARSSFFGVSCVVPTTEQDHCEIKRAQQIALPKAQYNAEYRTKRVLNVLGYYAFIAPGIAAKVIYDNQRDKALSESNQIANELAAMCEAPEQAVRLPASRQ